MEVDAESHGDEQLDTVASEKERKLEQAKAAEHIREILDIDKDVTRCLDAAGKAVKSLTGSQDTTEGDENNEDEDEDEEEAASAGLERSKQRFDRHTNDYYTLVQSIAARLRRQIYALEEADIIAPNQTSMQQQAAPPAPQSRPNALPRATGARTGTTAAAMQQQRVEPPMEITNGGLGNLDIGWLNSRGDQVGLHKEAELWAQARAHLERMRDGGSGADDMDVDERVPSGS